ncbi:MAG: hypothetical protein K2L26_00495, partial [Duncaniella sp.]|nr:hypothetical protein [Duncaniella sp.]
SVPLHKSLLFSMNGRLFVLTDSTTAKQTAGKTASQTDRASQPATRAFSGQQILGVSRFSGQRIIQVDDWWPYPPAKSAATTFFIMLLGKVWKRDNDIFRIFAGT